MTEDFIETFSTTLDGVPLRVRYGVDGEEGYIYLINVMTRSDDDLLGILSKEAVSELEDKAERVYAKFVKEWNDDARIARAEE